MRELHAINWGELQCAYGSAHAVEAMLRDAASQDAATRDAARDGLFSHVWHQGTIYEVTAVAVPFIAELVTSSIKGRIDLLELLRVIWFGQSYNEQHAQYEPPSVLESTEWQAQTAREREWVQAARDAIAAELPRFKRLAMDTDQPELIRWMATRLWSLIAPPEGDELRGLLEGAPEIVRAGLVLNGVDVRPTSEDDLPLVRVARVIVALRSDIDTPLVERALSALAVAPDAVTGWDLLPGVHRRGPAMSLLVPVIQQGERFAQVVVERVPSLFPRLGEVAANATASGVLFLLLRSGASFDEAALRNMLTALVACDSLWTPAIVATLESYALPTTREELAQLAQGPDTALSPFLRQA